jgi:hypothetical protein
VRSPGKDLDELIPQDAPGDDGESVPGFGPSGRIVRTESGKDCFLVRGIDLDITDTTDFNPRLTHWRAYVDGPDVVKLDGVELAAAESPLYSPRDKGR